VDFLNITIISSGGIHIKAKNKNKSKKLCSTEESRNEEVLGVVLIAIASILMISMFTNINMGWIGENLTRFIRFIFGFFSYSIPIIFMYFGIFFFLNKKEYFNKRYIVLFSTLILLLDILIYVINNSDSQDSLMFSVIDLVNKGDSIFYPGLVGSLFGFVLVIFFGGIGSYIFIFTLMFILMLVITKISMYKLLSVVSYALRTILKKLYIMIIDKFRMRDKVQDVHREYNNEDQGDIYSFKGDVFNLVDTNLQEYDNDGTFNNTLELDKPIRFDYENVINKEESKRVDEALVTEHNVAEHLSKVRSELNLNIIMKGFERPVHGHDLDMEEDVLSISGKSSYVYPKLSFLNYIANKESTDDRSFILDNSKKLESTLKSFGVIAKVVEVSKGPTVTRYEVQPGEGVKVSKISSLADDLALNLAAKGIRIESPIPGKAAVGIEIPNKNMSSVYLREVIESKIFKEYKSNLAVGLGKDISGNPIIADIAKMPHVLIAGATGSGKSVCINTIIISLLYRSKPEEIKILMIDPKVVELGVYNGIPHLLIPVVTEAKKAAGALNWAVQEMVSRYKLFADLGVRDLGGYNEAKVRCNEEKLPQIVIIIDELADLMMLASKEVEESICRLAQMARAAGIHLIIATQRPSVDVITGLIKANIPSRLAFAVSSGTDSRTVLDVTGAEKLLGKGDMLFLPAGLAKPLRIQGAFITDKEVERVVNFLKADACNIYDDALINKITSKVSNVGASGDIDEFFEEAVIFIMEKGKASTSMLQRQFRIGYNRASRIMDTLEDMNIVGEEEGSKSRKVLMSLNEWKIQKDMMLGRDKGGAFK
jgi:S-DNA-T family DNA segregation ATPase FtsK/SpoIIIE